MLTIRWLPFALALVVAGVHSQEPVPTPAKGIQKPETKPQSRKNYSARDKRGTEESPLVIKGIPAERDQKEAEREAEERKEKTAIDRGIRGFTGLTALATFLLFFVAGTQVVLFVWQLRLIQESVRDARKALVSTHRPRIRVRNIVVKQSTPIGGVKPTLFAQGTYIGGQFYIENVGGTRAYILESHCQVFWTDKGLPMERPYEGKDPNIPISRDCELQAGQSMPIIFQSERLMDDRADDILAGNSYWKIYVMGWIAYGDDLGIRRRTAFCREYRGALNAAEGRFYPVGDSDYEQEN